MTVVPSGGIVMTLSEAGELGDMIVVVNPRGPAVIVVTTLLGPLGMLDPRNKVTMVPFGNVVVTPSPQSVIGDARLGPRNSVTVCPFGSAVTLPDPQT